MASPGPAGNPSEGGNAIVVARYAYKAVDITELTVKKSERLMLLDDSQHWWRVQNSSGQEGYVPSNYMKRARQGLFSSLKSSLSKKKKRRDDGGRERSHSVVAGGAGIGAAGVGSDKPAVLSPPPPDAAAALAAPFGGLDQLPPQTAPPQLPARIAVARYAYTATQEDELTLAKGERVAVLEESSDGWWRGRQLGSGDGTQQRLSGWFPSNYVLLDVADNEEFGGNGISSVVVEEAVPGPATAEERRPALFRVLALYRFTASHSEEMDFAESETLSVLATPPDDPDWWLARNAAGRQGLVPRNYVRVLPPDGAASASASASASVPTPPAAAPVASVATSAANPRLAYVAGDNHPGLADRPYYWGRIGRSEADRMLMQMAAPGEFIVRSGESNPEDLTLTMRAKTKNRNFKIKQMEEPNGLRFNIGQKYFNDLDALIRHYKEHPIYRSEDERCYLVAAFQHPNFAGTKL